MSPTFPVSPPPAPPAPPAPTSGASSDPSSQGGRSFSDILKDTTSATTQPAASSNSSQTTAAATDGSKKPDTNAASADADQTDTQPSGADKTTPQGAAGDASGATDDAGAADLANQAQRAVAAAQFDKSPVGKDTSARIDNKAKAADQSAAGVVAAAEAEPALADEQTVSAVEAKPGTNSKSKGAKSTASSASPDSANLAVGLPVQGHLPTAATVASTTDKPGTSSSSSDSKPTTCGNPVDAVDKDAGKSALRAEQSVDPGKASGDSSKQKLGDAASQNGTAKSDIASAVAASSNGTSGAPSTVKVSDHSVSDSSPSTFQQQLGGTTTVTKTGDEVKTVAAPVAAPVPSAPTAADFAAANHAQIVRSVHTQLLPNGGSIQLRLDPPDLGTMQVVVRMRDGMMSAEFQASSDQAARLLGHSLGDLKTQLETQGVTVEKLHVTSAPRETRNGNGDSGSRQREQNPSQEQQREQQRKEMIRRMWAKLAKGAGPLDMVA